MSYRLTLAGGDDPGMSPSQATLCLLYNPKTSALTDEVNEKSSFTHPAFTTNENVSWRVRRRVSPNNPGQKKNIRTLKIQMGFSCNYACAYCNQSSWNSFIGGAVEDAKLFLHNLDNWFTCDRPATDEGEDIRIEFWGGEPFIYWAKLKILGAELRQRLPKAQFNVITNGSLLDDEKVDWLIKHGFGVQISHDGPTQLYRNPEDILDDPEKCRLIRKLLQAAGQLAGSNENDGSRVNCDAEAAKEDAIEQAIPQLRLGFGTVLTRWNYSLAAVREHIETKLNVPPGTISSNTEEILMPYDDDALACVPHGEREHRQAMHTLFMEAANGLTVPGCNSVRTKIEDFFDSLGKKRPLTALGQKCGMDREDTIAVNLMGDVTTCHNVSADDPRHNLGHVSDLNAVRLDSAHHHQTRDECKNCPVVQLCKGSCMFLEGKYWTAACDISFTYNLAMLAAALFYMTGMTLTKIEALDGGCIRRPGTTEVDVIKLNSPHREALDDAGPKAAE